MKPLDPVLTALLALEHFKLCCDEEAASGSSIPVDIVVMPDFVIDVDGTTISKINELGDGHNGIQSPAEIGSRAGRVLSILAYLRELDDESFRLHYIAKTGRAGQTLFHNRLNLHLRKRHLQPVQSNLLIPTRSGETRYSVFGRSTYKHVEPQVLRCKGELVLTPEELINHFYNPIDTLRHASAIYFATDSAEQFEKLIFLTLWGKPTREHNEPQPDVKLRQRHIIIDLSAIHDEKGQRITGIPTAVTKKLQSMMIDFVHDRGEYSNQPKNGTSHSLIKVTNLTFIVRVANVDTARDIFVNLNLSSNRDTLIVYDKQHISIGSGENYLKSPRCWSDHQPNGREAYIAAVVLFKAIEATAEALPSLEKVCYFAQTQHRWQDSLMGANGEKFFKCHENTNAFAVSLGTLWKDITASSKNLPNFLELLVGRLDGKDRLKYSFANAKIIEDIGSLHAKTREWCVAVACLTREYIDASLVDTEASRSFVAYLKDNLEKAPVLFDRPEGWDPTNRTRALNFNSPFTARAQFALKMLRLISVTTGNPLGYLLQIIRTGNLPENGKQLIALANVDGRLAIRIFDRSGEKIVDEHVVIADDVNELDHLRRLTDQIDPEKPIPPTQQRDIIQRVTNIVGEFRDVYLTDLDSTLVDSTQLREICLRRSFLTIFVEGEEDCSARYPFPILSPDTSQHLTRCTRLYNEYIYNKHAEWAKIFLNYHADGRDGHPYDFRQVWNHPLSYAAFFWFLKYVGELPQWTTPKQVLENLDAITWPDEDDILERIGKSITDEKICDEVASIAAKYRRTFQAAVTAFWQVNYSPFRHTRECLRTLRDVLGANVYIATEGDHDTQVAKVRLVGLEDFFPEHATLSTGAAATPYEDFSLIHDDYEKRLNELKLIRRIRQNQYRRMNPREEKLRQKELDYLQVYIRQWEAHRRKPDIYALVMASVFTEPKFPLMVLTSLRHLNWMLETSPKKSLAKRCVMIGDRETVDIEPFLCAVNNRASGLRFLAGKKKRMYEDEGVYWRPPVKNRPLLAEFAVWSPSQTFLLLSQSTAWPRPINYGDLLPVVKHAFITEDGIFDENLFDAMLWGEEMCKKNEPGGATYSLMNSLRIRGTASICDSSLLCAALANRLHAARNEHRLGEYSFLLIIMQRVWPIIVGRNHSVETAGGLLASAIFVELSTWSLMPKAAEFEVDIVNAIVPILKKCLICPNARVTSRVIDNDRSQVALRTALEQSENVFKRANMFVEAFIARLNKSRLDKEISDYRYLLAKINEMWREVELRNPGKFEAESLFDFLHYMEQEKNDAVQTPDLVDDGALANFDAIIGRLEALLKPPTH